MRKVYILLLCIILTACSAGGESKTGKEPTSIGLLLSESGLGDESYSDSAIRGLKQARDELGIVFDYREPLEMDFKPKLEELIDRGHNVIIALGFEAETAINEVADQYPEKQFVLIDAVSDRPNVISITFKADEGSYLVGVLAGLKTKSNVVGFIGGDKVPAIEVFEDGFREGVKSVNNKAKVLVDYAGTFGDDKIGATIAKKQIQQEADYIFPAAGFTGMGVFTEAQKEGIYAFGVDSDQFFVAEQAIVSSMLKNIDVALYNIVKEIDDGKSLSGEHLELGISEGGVGLAPIRIIELTAEEQSILDAVIQKGGL